MDVRVNTFKEPDLRGATLLVSIPQASVGNILLTDFLLEHNKMDHVAAFDADGFPPVAMLHGGKARFPMRVHANAKRRAAILRGEFAPSAELARPLARAILDWAEEQELERIVVLDAVRVVETPITAVPTRDGDAQAGAPPLYFAASLQATRQHAKDEGLTEFERGALGGVSAVLLLESRLRGFDTVVLLAGLSEELDDPKSVLAFADVLPVFLPDLKIDSDAARERFDEILEAVTSLQHQAHDALRHMRGQSGAPEAQQTPMYR